MSKFKEALENLANGVEDLTSLEVFTYTGEVNAVLNKEGDGIAWDELFSKSKANEGTLQLVAATRVQFDGDTQNFQTSGNVARLTEMLQVHEQSVNNSRLARQSLVQFFSGNLLNLVGGTGKGAGTGGTGSGTGGTGK